jgi:spermidine synthase
MKRTLNAGFLLMGFSFTVAQGLLVRELLVAFFGNELSIGLVLGSWLILEATGSGLVGKLTEQWEGKASSFAALQVLFALFLPLSLYAACMSRSIVGAIPGQGVGLIPIFYSSFLILAPLALVDGAMFTFGCRAYAALTGRDTLPIGRVYVFESAGAIVGGIVFTYLLIPLLYSLHIVLLLSALNLLSAALLLGTSDLSRKGAPFLTARLVVVLALLASCLGFLFSPQAEAVQRWIASKQWAGYNLVYSQNSVYGNVAVIQQETQYTFYADGIPILTAPVPDVALSEEFIHLPLLFVPHPRRALVLSGGAGGLLHELLKYPLEEIDYAELDPLLIEAISEFPTSLTVGELGDPRVRIEHVDGRLLVREKSQQTGSHPPKRYDLIVANLPYPSTLRLNRFYTAEFFQMVRGLLTEDGLLVIPCPGRLSYMSEELRDLNAMVYQTLGQAFPHVRPIPGDLTLWLASPSDRLSTTPLETLVEQWRNRDLETWLMADQYIRLKLDPERLDWFWRSLGQETRGSTKVNRDLHPLGILYGLAYWNALFSPRLARVLAFIGRLSLWKLALPLVGCVLLSLAITKLTSRGKKAILPIAIATTGFAGMAADLVIVFAFQTLYGYVYHWVGLLIAAFMAGLSLGGLLTTRRLAKVRRERSVLLRLELALVFYWLLLPAILIVLYSPIARPLSFTVIQGGLFLLNAVAGFLVGSQFPLGNKMWLAGQEDLRGTAGILYACDLAGAFVGSVAVSVVLIPVLGMVETCFLVAVLKLGSLLLILNLSPRA